MSDTDPALRALAEAATPGPWHLATSELENKHAGVCDTNGRTVVGGLRTLRVNAAYIAAVSPDVVLSLLDRLAAAEAAPLDLDSRLRVTVNDVVTRMERGELSGRNAMLTLRAALRSPDTETAG